MNQRIRSPKSLRQRKLLLMLPLLVLPFLILLFTALGGGRGPDATHNQKTEGLNVKLPDAHFKKGKEKTKLLLYEEAGRDSALLAEKMKNDPYYSLRQKNISPSDSNMEFPGLAKKPDEHEAKIMEKLDRLRSITSKKNPGTNMQNNLTSAGPARTEQIEKLMASLQNAAGEDPRINHSEVRDPKIEQINAMLNKVMAIQHPELMEDSIARMAAEHKSFSYPVNLNQSPNEPVSFGARSGASGRTGFVVNRFYDLHENTQAHNESDNGIEAEIPETQSLVSGSTIRLRLLNEINIHGHVVPKNQFIYGIVSLSNERLKIQFSSIRSGNNILPVTLEAYDLDGMAGLFIPGSINREVAKQSGDQAMGTMGLTTLDPSFGAQAAGAGIQAAKSLISRKVKLIKVTVKAGYRILLKDSNKK